MVLELIPIEWKKHKGTILPWMLGMAGIFTSGVSALFTATGYAEAAWAPMAESGFHFMNLLSLLLAAVFTGLVFSGENSNNIDNILFTYPVSRMKFLLSKYIVLLLITAVMYAIFAVFLLLFGFLCIGELPEASMLITVARCTLAMSAANFLTIPLTSLVCQLVKGVGTGVFTGMAYFVVYVSFFTSEYSAWIPVCLPDRLLLEFFGPRTLDGKDIATITAICIILLFSSITASAVYYMKRDISG